MSINLKDTNVIKCLSYNAYSDKFNESVDIGMAKITRTFGLDRDKYGRRNDKWTENVLTYSKEKADMREVYSGWNGFSIFESPSCPEYRFAFFQDSKEHYNYILRLICVEKGEERKFVLGIIFDGIDPDKNRYKNRDYKDICKGEFTFKINEEKISGIEKLSGDSIIWADINRKSAIILFSVPNTFVKNLVKKDSDLYISYRGKKTYTIYLGDDNKWYSLLELCECGMETIINYDEWRHNDAEPIYREEETRYENHDGFPFDVPEEWESLYKEIAEGKIAEYVKSSDSFNEKFPLLAKYGITKKRAIIYLAIFAILLLSFINDATNGHGTSAYINIFLVFIGVIAWIHRPKE